MVKLLKEIAGGDGHFAKGVVGMLRCPCGELRAPFGELLNVEHAKARHQFRHAGKSGAFHFI